MIDIQIEMADGMDVFLCSGARFGFQGVHPDVDVARFFFIFELQPLLKGRFHDLGRGRDALNRFASAAISYQDSEPVRRIKGRSDVFGSGDAFFVLFFFSRHAGVSCLW
jgi:hypothetical protein